MWQFATIIEPIPRSVMQMLNPGGFQGGVKLEGEVSISREAVEGQYRTILANNPLLAQVDAELRTAGWADLEIRNAQLQLAVATIVQLQSELWQLKNLLVAPTQKRSEPLPARAERRKRLLQG